MLSSHSLWQLACSLGLGVANPLEDIPAAGVNFHTQRLQAREAFFALPGANSHGIVFADEALAAGAAFVVSDKPHPRGLQVRDPAALLLELGYRARADYPGRIIGITGSSGKTSSRAMLSTALAAHSVQGNLNTPLAIAAFLVGLQQQPLGAKSLTVLELGIDHPGEMAQLLALVRPHYGLLTLISSSHLEALGDVAGVAREKSQLIDAAERSWVSAQAYPFLNAAQRHKSLCYGLCDSDAALDICGRMLQADAYGQQLEIASLQLQLPYPGRAMATNAVGAVAIALHCGVAPETIAARLATLQLEPARLHMHRRKELTVIDDSYNSNPASAQAALEVLAALPRPHVAILGDMLELGFASEEAHRQLGQASRSLDACYFVGEASRWAAEENPRAYYAASLDAIMPLLAEQFPAEPPVQASVLLKASRGLRFERLVQWFLARYPA